MKNQQKKTDKIIVKRYSNRRLYNCSVSKYIKLKDLISLISRNQNFKIEDHITGEDLTQQTLIQLIYEVNNPVNPIFTENFIKELFKVLPKFNQNEVSEYLELCLNKFVGFYEEKPKNRKNLDILDLQLQILELKKLIIDRNH